MMDPAVNVSSNHEFNYAYFIQENEQDSLKGLLWVSAGSIVACTSLVLTAGTIGLVGLTALSGLAKERIPDIPPFTKMVILTAAASSLSHFSVKFASFCFNNALYHYGPEFQIVRR